MEGKGKNKLQKGYNIMAGRWHVWIQKKKKRKKDGYE